MKKALIFTGIAIVVAAIAYFGYKAYKKGKIDPAQNPATGSDTPTVTKPTFTIISSLPAIQKASVITRG